VDRGRLVIFSPAGEMLATISPGIGEGDLVMPRRVAVDDSGKLWERGVRDRATVSEQ
jgi:hypothetical protein